jgi:alkanesulfonate monooxygenase SsuD/methylene tetrahydromethanopterin reductase-like flavin-dependent oxidoreductase (luciferase family)
LQPPLPEGLTLWSEQEIAGVNHALAHAVVGSRATVRAGLERFIAETAADELMVTAQIYDHQARLHSYRLVAEIRDELGAPA